MQFSKILVSASIFFACSVVVPAQTKPHSSQGATEANINVILDRLELSTGKFRLNVNRALVQSRVDQTTSPNDINTFVPRLQAAIYQLRIKNDNPGETRTSVESLLRQASLVDAFMIQHRLNKQVQGDWAAVRTDLNLLARNYGVTWSWNRQSVSPPYANGSAYLSDEVLNQLIQRLETGGDTFRSSLTDAFDLTGYDKTPGEGRMNNDLRGLKKETDQLRSQFDARQPLTGIVTNLLVRTRPIDTYMRENLLTNRVQNDWRTLYSDINTLAVAYNLSEMRRR